MSTKALFSSLSEEDQFKQVINSISGISNKQESKRYNSGKAQTNEIDPSFILGMAEVLTKSREKYDRANWTLPTNWSTPYDSMMRHIMAFQKGEELDAESGNSHLLHAAVNLMFLYYHSINSPETDDRIFKKENK